MLKGINIMQGLFYFDVKEGEYHESTLFNLAKLLDGIIFEEFDFIGYESTARLDNKINIVLNLDELHTAEFNKGDSVSFYSHSKELFMGNIGSKIARSMERLLEPSDFSGVKVCFDVKTTVFDDVDASPINMIDSKETYTIKVDDKDNISVNRHVDYVNVYKSIEYSDISKNTNLFIFDDTSYLGVLGIEDQLICLHNEIDTLTWFEGFQDKNTRLVARILASTTNKDDLGITVGENITMLSDVLSGTMENEYLIGTYELLAFMKDVSPLVLKEVLSKGEI